MGFGGKVILTVSDFRLRFFESSSSEPELTAVPRGGRGGGGLEADGFGSDCCSINSRLRRPQKLVEPDFIFCKTHLRLASRRQSALNLFHTLQPKLL
jgi:hypothetical protein